METFQTVSALHLLGNAYLAGRVLMRLDRGKAGYQAVATLTVKFATAKNEVLWSLGLKYISLRVHTRTEGLFTELPRA